MSYLIIDTREPSEYARSHVEGAINISAQEFLAGLPTDLQNLNKNQPILVYCLSGARSNTVSHILNGYGFTNITNGINEGHVRQLLQRES